MPEFELSPGVSMFYRDDNLTDPWTNPEAAFLLHGNSENGHAWNGWMPFLARRFRIVRPDMRGFGKSTPMPEDYPWSVDEIIDDYIRLADHLRIDRFHLVGAKLGGGLSLRLAAMHRKRVRTLTVCAARVRGSEAVAGRADVPERVRHGMAAWARETMSGRLGSDCPADMLEGWVQLMADTPASTQIGFMTHVPGMNVTDDLPKIVCSTLLIGSENSTNLSAASMWEWGKTIPQAEVVAVPGNSYHVAATQPEQCARAMLEFIDRRGAPA